MWKKKIIWEKLLKMLIFEFRHSAVYDFYSAAVKRTGALSRLKRGLVLISITAGESSKALAAIVLCIKVNTLGEQPRFSEGSFTPDDILSTSWPSLRREGIYVYSTRGSASRRAGKSADNIAMCLWGIFLCFLRIYTALKFLSQLLLRKYRERLSPAFYLFIDHQNTLLCAR